MAKDDTPVHNFVRQIILDDLDSGKHRDIQTRFPPEPNGTLHLGHAKAICLDFGIAREFSGRCNLRMDDTNPGKEDPAFTQAIHDEVRWLGFEWNAECHASDYFEVFYRAALKLIDDGLAYVDDLDAEQVRQYRGSLTEAGSNSPYRERGVAENRDLFQRMRAGEFEAGTKTLRAKMDMAAGNINMRDPAIYRIRNLPHARAGDAWPIYPMYDYAHCLSDALEGITHSLCTLEFEDHRPLYDWFVDAVNLPEHPELWQDLADAGYAVKPAKPRQIEFARGNLDHTVLSKRKLTQLIEDDLVDGWDDPRLPTLAGVRRRGFTPAAIRTFWQRAGASKQNSVIDMGVLEACVREDLETTAPRRMAVLDPLKVVIDNLPAEHEETITFPNHPKDPAFGERSIPVSRELWIERGDFAEEPPKGFRRLVPEGEVRLRGIGIVQCQQVDKTAAGEVNCLHVTLDPETRPGCEQAGRKVKGTIHWVSAAHAVHAEVRLYDRLFTVPDPAGGNADFRDYINPDSRRTIEAMLEPAAGNDVPPETHFQFERLGYFMTDPIDHTAAAPVFNRCVTLRDTWSRKGGK